MHLFYEAKEDLIAVKYSLCSDAKTVTLYVLIIYVWLLLILAIVYFIMINFLKLQA